jgi:hypothetical protein
MYKEQWTEADQNEIFLKNKVVIGVVGYFNSLS